MEEPNVPLYLSFGKRPLNPDQWYLRSELKIIDYVRDGCINEKPFGMVELFLGSEDKLIKITFNRTENLKIVKAKSPKYRDQMIKTYITKFEKYYILKYLTARKNYTFDEFFVIRHFPLIGSYFEQLKFTWTCSQMIYLILRNISKIKFISDCDYQLVTPQKLFRLIDNVPGYQHISKPQWQNIVYNSNNN